MIIINSVLKNILSVNSHPMSSHREKEEKNASLQG